MKTKTLILSLGLITLCSFFFTGCNIKKNNATNPSTKNTPIEEENLNQKATEINSDTTNPSNSSTKPNQVEPTTTPLSQSDEISDLSQELNETIILEEDFSDLE